MAHRHLRLGLRVLDEARPEDGANGGVQHVERPAHHARRLDPEDPLRRRIERRDDAVFPGGDDARVHAPEQTLVVLLDRDDLVVELRVLEPDGELARQGLEEVELVAEERVAGELGADQDDGHQPAVPDRHRHLGAPGPEVLEHGARIHARGPSPDVIPDERGRPVRQLLDERARPGHRLRGPRDGRVDVPGHEGREGVAVPDPHEDGEALEMEGPVDQVRHGGRHPRGVGEGAHRPASLADEGARVVGGPVQVPVGEMAHARREPEEQRGGGQPQHHGACGREGRVRLGEERVQEDLAADQQGRRQQPARRVGRRPADDHPHVHEPVPHDGVGGEAEPEQREVGPVHAEPRGSGDERHDDAEREGARSP